MPLRNTLEVKPVIIQNEQEADGEAESLGEQLISERFPLEDLSRPRIQAFTDQNGVSPLFDHDCAFLGVPFMPAMQRLAVWYGEVCSQRIS